MSRPLKQATILLRFPHLRVFLPPAAHGTRPAATGAPYRISHLLHMVHDQQHHTIPPTLATVVSYLLSISFTRYLPSTHRTTHTFLFLTRYTIKDHLRYHSLPPYLNTVHQALPGVPYFTCHLHVIPDSSGRTMRYKYSLYTVHNNYD